MILVLRIIPGVSFNIELNYSMLMRLNSNGLQPPFSAKFHHFLFLLSWDVCCLSSFVVYHQSISLQLWDANVKFIKPTACLFGHFSLLPWSFPSLLAAPIFLSHIQIYLLLNMYQGLLFVTSLITDVYVILTALSLLIAEKFDTCKFSTSKEVCSIVCC